MQFNFNLSNQSGAIAQAIAENIESGRYTAQDVDKININLELLEIERTASNGQK